MAFNERHSDTFSVKGQPVMVGDSDSTSYTDSDTGEVWDFTKGKGFRQVGSLGTIGILSTKNLNGIHYVDGVMRKYIDFKYPTIENDGLAYDLPFDLVGEIIENSELPLDLPFDLTTNDVVLPEYPYTFPITLK